MRAAHTFDSSHAGMLTADAAVVFGKLLTRETSFKDGDAADLSRPFVVEASGPACSQVLQYQGTRPQHCR